VFQRDGLRSPLNPRVGPLMAQFDPYDSLVPVFLETEIPNRVYQIGTAIFRELWGEPFLFTAAHVTDELKNGTLRVPTEAGLSPIEGYMAHIDIPPEISRLDDNVDIAYYRLSTEFALQLSHHFKPLPQGQGEIIRSAHELTVCSASGYPASKSKKNGNTFSSEIYSFRGVIARQETYDRFDLSPEQAIIIHFHKKRAVHPGTMDAFPTPSLKGSSGGGIFAWPRGSELSDDWSLPRLVGIIHTFKEREGLIIGTTLLPVLAAITLGRMKNFGGIQ
jgi:hypothetical protein